MQWDIVADTNHIRSAVIGHFVIHIVTNKVHQLKRSHAESSDRLHGPVDSMDVGKAFFVNAKCFTIKGTGNSVNDEGRRILRNDGHLPPALHQRFHFFYQSTTRLQGRYNLNQLHQWRWVKEMQANHAGWIHAASCNS